MPAHATTARLGKRTPFVVCDDNTWAVAGKRVDEILTAAGIAHGLYVIPLEKYKTLKYERFDLKIPKDDVVKYYAPALTNSSNHAELYVRNLPVETDFFGRDPETVKQARFVLAVALTAADAYWSRLTSDAFRLREADEAGYRPKHEKKTETKTETKEEGA